MKLTALIENNATGNLIVRTWTIAVHIEYKALKQISFRYWC